MFTPIRVIYACMSECHVKYMGTYVNIGIRVNIWVHMFTPIRVFISSGLKVTLTLSKRV